MKKIKTNEKSIKSLIFLAVLILSPFVVINGKANAAADASLSFNPSSTIVINGEAFSVDIMINPGNHQISNADLTLTFDPARLDLTTITNASSPFSVTQALNIGSGTANYSAGTTFGTNVTAAGIAPATSALYATLHFTAKATGNPIVSISNNTAFYADDEPGVNQLSSTNVNTAITINPGDITPPTAAITYSLNRNIKSSDSQLITATFSEPMAGAPVPTIAISGNNTVAATNMTFVDATHYTYAYSGAIGNGDDTITLSAGTDLAGNALVAVPTSGATFTVDNTPPSITNGVSITSPGKGTTPSYSFNSTESGAIIYGGGCSSTTTPTAAPGVNAITYNALVPGTYSACTIRVTDAADNQSAVFAVPPFVIIWPADLNGVTGVDGADYSLLHASYNPFIPQPGNVADINADNYVNGSDYSFLHAEYGKPY